MQIHAVVRRHPGVRRERVGAVRCRRCRRLVLEHPQEAGDDLVDRHGVVAVVGTHRDVPAERDRSEPVGGRRPELGLEVREHPVALRGVVPLDPEHRHHPHPGVGRPAHPGLADHLGGEQRNLPRGPRHVPRAPLLGLLLVAGVGRAKPAVQPVGVAVHKDRPVRPQHVHRRAHKVPVPDLVRKLDVDLAASRERPVEEGHQVGDVLVQKRRVELRDAPRGGVRRAAEPRGPAALAGVARRHVDPHVGLDGVGEPRNHLPRHPRPTGAVRSKEV
mmetsp:Transcript_30514/g.91471  ORF Transcript_30514/g.91471 Transcript_30514/m.91471 type:complete len:274 (+) Transcript_30514:856-1677(+)